MSIFPTTSTVNLSERDNNETLFVKEEETNDIEVVGEVVVEVAGLLKEPTSKFSCRNLPTSHHFLNHSDVHEGPQEESRRPGNDKAMNKAMKLAHAKMMKDPKKRAADLEKDRKLGVEPTDKAMKLAHAKMMMNDKAH